jgi:plasmid stabilization system protein ParE
MPARRLILSLEAEHDLDELFDWIARDTGVDRAAAVLRRIDQTLELVAGMPRIGRVRRDLDGEPRTFSVWPWIIVYEPQQGGRGIIVWRVIDGRRDLPQHVRPPGER